MWLQKHVVCDLNDNYCKGTVDLFTKMFPDSKVIEKIELEPNKLKDITNHRTLTYVQGILTVVIRDAEWFVVSFDEFLNEITKFNRSNFVSVFEIMKNVRSRVNIGLVCS